MRGGYEYVILNSNFSDYNIEQQGTIVADYFLKQNGWTTNEWESGLSQNIPESVYMFLVNEGLGL